MAADKVSKDHGEIFGLINNAGGFLSTHRDTVDLNTYGAIRVSNEFIPLLQSNGKLKIGAKGRSHSKKNKRKTLKSRDLSD